MAPAADMRYSAEAMLDCFLYSNISPQAPALNRGPWADLEAACRSWASGRGSVHIVAGPIYDIAHDPRPPRHIGSNYVTVPEAFFKVILKRQPGKISAIAVVFPNGNPDGSWQRYSMSVNDLEELLDMDFFWLLPDELEDSVEASSSLSDWQ
jgi:endonuclease G